MRQKIYALLVGIDDYPQPVNPLKGCINDVMAVEAYLRGRVASEGFELDLQVLKDREASREAIIRGFREHLCQATQNDVALFYYSGHGSQEQAPPEFWHLEPDRLDETLVCWDSRTDGGWDLADKELAKLVAEVAENNPHITLILDCCHSGSGSRNPLLEASVRRVPTDTRFRPLNSFIFSPQELEQLTRTPGTIDKNATGWNLPKGRHVLLAACLDSEEAKEYHADCGVRGAFCYFLLDTLQKANGSLTYRDLFNRTKSLVRNQVVEQSPQLEATHIEDLQQPFLGGAIAPSPAYFTISYHLSHGWIIQDGGAVHGIPPVAEDETTCLALFPFDCKVESLRQLANAVGTAEVTEVFPQLSQVKISGINHLPKDATFKAVVTNLPLPRHGVRLSGDVKGVQMLRQAMQTSQLGQPSIYVKEVTGKEVARFQVIAVNGEFLIVRPEDDRPLVAPVTDYTQANADLVVQRLEHITRWNNMSELAKPASSRIAPDAVKMEIYRDDELLDNSQTRLEYRLENGTLKQPRLFIKLKNTSQERLYCVLINLTEEYEIKPDFIANCGVWLNPGEEAWAKDKKPIYLGVPKTWWENGVTEFKDIFKLIVSTDEFDAARFQQAKLDYAPTRNVGEGVKYKSTLSRLMNRLQTRASDRPEDEELYDDWVTNQVTITTVKPLVKVPVPKERNGVSLGSGVFLKTHHGLQADVRLSTVSQSTRDVRNHVIPPILRDNPDVIRPFPFTSSRGSSPGLSALELSNINYETIKTVTPQRPLQLLVDMNLSKGEKVLAVAHDGEYFLPLGLGSFKDGKTEIRIERLPEPVSEGRRSISGAIRIFFYLKVSELTSQEFDYPLLQVARVDERENVTYESDLRAIREKVAGAKRIALFIHGIIGDTESMVKSVQQAKVRNNGQEKLPYNTYDLVLCLDYENLNTPIQKTAELLGQRLASVGLGANHSKELHIIAHSMGGLVSRWFIERLGGNKVVSHLIMLGTPNAGSPWSSVQDWATSLLAFVINNLSPIPLPVKIVSQLLNVIEAIDTTLDQMQSKSDFLQQLAASPDPKVPYTIIAGNTSTMVAANHWEKLKSTLVNKAIAVPFLGQTNDIAVTVASIQNVNQKRSPQPRIIEIPCNHLIYFQDERGLKALSQAIEQAIKRKAQ
jgi:pimeloyl-ACP methyl ester carboxylesterase